jgi:molybdopterin molybdotransferase
MTGASIPDGATAVLASEFAREHENGEEVTAFADAKSGKNILERGGEIRAGQTLVVEDQLITPALAGLLAASGVGHATVYKQPGVALVATGSEIVRQGEALGAGQIFQSNQHVTQSWLRAYGIDAEIFIVRDSYAGLMDMIDNLLPRFDIIITSGGLLAGDRDLVLPVMEELGTEYLFQRVKMGPGKGVCLGICRDRTIFNLPGGPPSNYLAFMLLALPGVLRLAGRSAPFRPVLKARLKGEIRGRRAWTQFSFAQKRWEEDGRLSAVPCDPGSRLMKIAMADCVVEVPEGTELLEKGQLVRIHDFTFQNG